VYDLANDRAETRNLAAEQSDLIQQAKDVLQREVDENDIFPLTIPDLAADVQ
jgi:hypothetical protein